ncbi:MAG: hypothetical protein ABI333_12915 [bacterium]
MSNLGYHIRIRLRDDRVIATDQRQRRILARAVLEQGRHSGLYAFGFPDHHLHAAARCTRKEAGGLAHRIGVSLKRKLALPVGFVQHPPKPIADTWHLYNAVEYILTQPEHHELDPELDPRHDASSLPDLLGLRPIGSYTAEHVRRWLPRLRRAAALKWLGVPALDPVDGPLDSIVEATLAAGCRNNLVGSSKEVIDLRCAAVKVIGNRRTAEEIAAMLEVSLRTVTWLRGRSVDEALVRAIRLQLNLTAQLGIRKRSIGAELG